MNPTLTEILAALYQAHTEIDRLRARVAQLEQEGQQQVAEFAERLAALEAERTPKDA